jgi:antitoxin component of MazEF toxin-antitoxin module
MSQSVVGKWGKNLAVRVPVEVARATGLGEGERVEIETVDGDILIRRQAARARAREDAETAAAEIIAASRHHRLGDVSVRELLEEGRRG